MPLKPPFVSLKIAGLSAWPYPGQGSVFDFPIIRRTRLMHAGLVFGSRPILVLVKLYVLSRTRPGGTLGHSNRHIRGVRSVPIDIGIMSLGSPEC